MLKFGIVSVFPEMFSAVSEYGITARAVKQERISIELWNPRDFTQDTHRTVDDRPYGGGPGMVMLAEPLKRSIAEAKRALPKAKVAYLSPQGKRFKQQYVSELAAREEIILLCGRYEGVDERLIESAVDEEWSIGDFVLSGGELAAMVMLDVLSRTLPGVLGHEDSAAEDSFYNGILDCPHYSRPEQWQGLEVPEVLLSGNHQAIRIWRLKQAIARTCLRRPDLLRDKDLSEEEQRLLVEFKKENS